MLFRLQTPSICITPHIEYVEKKISVTLYSVISPPLNTGTHQKIKTSMFKEGHTLANRIL